MILDILKPAEYRYERKFLISQLSSYEIESFVRLHPAAFSEIYSPRFVNNIYFDTVGMEAYNDNLIGIKDRLKVRIRWYGELFGYIEKPVLELKIKRGFLGGKMHYPLGPFNLDGSYSITLQQNLFARADIPELVKDYLKSLRFSLLNRYRRKYYQSADGKYRITIDAGMEYYRIDGANNYFLAKTGRLDYAIMELKYAQEDDDGAISITSLFPVRITKSSKYVAGVEGINTSVL
jgi:hypothetical protein